MTEIQGRFIIKTSRAGRSDRRSDGSGEGRRRKLKTVVQLFRNEKERIVQIDVAGEEIQTTLGHPFYAVGKGWVKAGELKAGDVLKLYDGKEAEINSISIKESKPVITYNFEVEDSHTYYVTQSDVLCHNICQNANQKALTGLIKKTGKAIRYL